MISNMDGGAVAWGERQQSKARSWTKDGSGKRDQAVAALPKETIIFEEHWKLFKRNPGIKCLVGDGRAVWNGSMPMHNLRATDAATMAETLQSDYSRPGGMVRLHLGEDSSVVKNGLSPAFPWVIMLMKLIVRICQEVSGLHE